MLSWYLKYNYYIEKNVCWNASLKVKLQAALEVIFPRPNQITWAKRVLFNVVGDLNGMLHHLKRLNSFQPLSSSNRIWNTQLTKWATLNITSDSGHGIPKPYNLLLGNTTGYDHCCINWYLLHCRRCICLN